MSVQAEIRRRRTFAIIAHPDAGKTTLTEKLLLYGGAIQLAGSVTARRKQRAVTSDWMELERQRGISVTSTLLQFEYDGYVVNLLDTPGHRDFSEDTYRVLTAADSAVMVIDAAKGIEEQTRKLFEVCRRRAIPIFTFINKLDRPTRDLFGLLDELERVLGIRAVAMNWPIGTGPDFRGIFDRVTEEVHLFERTEGGAYRSPVRVSGMRDPVLRDDVGVQGHRAVVEELDLLDAAGATFDPAAVCEGKQTPVYFGSAVNNFGVQLFLDGFLRHASAPRPRRASSGLIEPSRTEFTGLVFKIQANMDPRHRDRIAFVRVCSGRFMRDMAVTNARTGRQMRLSSAHRMFGREREIVDEAYAGDVVGIVGQSDLRIGDTLANGETVHFEEIPSFAPECFSFIYCTNTLKYKQFRDGLEQLIQEGVIQLLQRPDASARVPILAAVGALQFDVVRFRLESEYGAESRLESAPWQIMRWLANPLDFDGLRPQLLPTSSTLVFDQHDRPAILFGSEWELNYLRTKFPRVRLVDTQGETSAAV